MRKIAVLTSGGDAPGMNAAIRAVVRKAIHDGMEVYSVNHGFNGLISNDINKAGLGDVGDIIHRGGTSLYTARCEKFRTEEGRQRAADNLKALGIEGLVVIGGDGTYMGAAELGKLGVKTVGVPATIDNDIVGTELSLGFNTAVQNVVETVDDIMLSAASHQHLYAIEVMGRRTGNIAEKAGRALDADGIIATYEDFDVQEVERTIKASQDMGKRYQLFIIAEGAMPADDFRKIVERETDYEIHSLVLGHIQRGGNPIAEDRILGMDFGETAVKELLDGVTGKFLAVKDNEIVEDEMPGA